jgi:uncharacterized protein YukJ
MGSNYGVLRGRVVRFRREEDLDRPHLQIKVFDRTGRAWRAAINIRSRDGSLVIFHRADPLEQHPILATLPHLAPGFTAIPANRRSATTALDYLRAPLFDWSGGVAVPQSGPGIYDDLQDMLAADLRWLRRERGELFIFGERFEVEEQPVYREQIDNIFHTTRGMHDIHMNQGNPTPGRFSNDNATFRDGGMILRAGARTVGLFLRFQAQWLPTDASGNRLPHARPVPPGQAPPRR